MTLVVLGIDALDPDLVDPGTHPHLTLEAYHSIDTIVSSSGEPSTHELWPTIITGLPPSEHGLQLDGGVAWDNPLLRVGSTLGRWMLPDFVQTRIGAWLLNNTQADAFRVPATYFEEHDIPTIFDACTAKAIGIPNYVTDPDTEDREQQLRRGLGELFERDSEAKGGHTSSDPQHFYELCMEMAMIRIARSRRALRAREYELVFGYTSGLDLIGHIAHDMPALQSRAYEELNEFVGELRGDLAETDDLLLISDHGLQDGLHTTEAMVAGTDQSIVTAIESVLDVYTTLTDALQDGHHQPTDRATETKIEHSKEVEEQLEDLGYF